MLPNYPCVRECNTFVSKMYITGQHPSRKAPMKSSHLSLPVHLITTVYLPNVTVSPFPLSFLYLCCLMSWWPICGYSDFKCDHLIPALNPSTASSGSQHNAETSQQGPYRISTYLPYILLPLHTLWPYQASTIPPVTSILFFYLQNPFLLFV